MGRLRVVTAGDGAVWAELQYDDTTLAIQRIDWENASPSPVSVAAQRGAITRAVTLRPGTGGSAAIPAGLMLTLVNAPGEATPTYRGGVIVSTRMP